MWTKEAPNLKLEIWQKSENDPSFLQCHWQGDDNPRWQDITSYAFLIRATSTVHCRLLDVVCCLGWILPLWSEARGAVICSLLKNIEHLLFSTTCSPEASCAREEVSAEECDRMLLWLWSLLSLPPPQPSTSSRPSRRDFSKISANEWESWDTP